MRRLGSLVGVAVCCGILACDPSRTVTLAPASPYVEDATVTAFSRPLSGLRDDELRGFAYGNRLFNTNWVPAPASVGILDGLGPLFNRVSCSGCHVRDGRGRPPDVGEDPQSMLVKLARDHERYGVQIQDRAIGGIRPEARVELVWRTRTGAFDDGTPYELREPEVVLRDLAYGDLDPETVLSPITAPAIHGLGLLESVPREELVRRADPGDTDGDGISGRLPLLRDGSLGRFGWKASQPSLLSQTVTAFSQDIGITSSVFPEENRADRQALPAYESGGRPEIEDRDLERLVLYTRVLAVPARRDPGSPLVRRGEALFDSVGCAACHATALALGDAAPAGLAGRVVAPFTDLLLHDMGPDLADGRPDGAATGSEWRTPPLWGVGLVETVNRHTFFLHDGRARNLEEAVLWHGGEAEASRKRYLALNSEERAALLAFLRSL